MAVRTCRVAPSPGTADPADTGPPDLQFGGDGLVFDIFGKYGPDSFIGMAASVLMSCTETLFYCLSIYFGSVGVTKTRYALPGALVATAVGIAASIFLSCF